MKNKRKAFTLIELIIVVVVIGIVGLATLPGYLDSQRRGQVVNGSGDVLRLIKEARNRAITGWSAEGGDAGQDADKGILPNAFGVYFTKIDETDDMAQDKEEGRRMVLFANVVDTDDDPDWLFDEVEDEVLEDYMLPNAARVLRMEVMDAGVQTEVDQAIVFFGTKDGRTYINYKKGSDDWAGGDNFDNIDWLRLDVYPWALADSEWGMQRLERARSVAVKTVSDYAYICSPQTDYNEADDVCNLE